MAKIRVDDQKAVKALREIVGSDDLFPYSDYALDDPKVHISITVYREHDDNPNLKTASRECIETNDGKLPEGLRKMLLQHLWKINPDQALIEKMRAIGIEVVYPGDSKGMFNRG